MEWKSLVGPKGLWYGVWWCVGEGGGRGRREGRGEEEEERKEISLSIPNSLKPRRTSLPGLPAGLPLAPSNHSLTHSTPYPIHGTQAQKWGIPTLLPTGGKGGKKGGKRALYKHTILNFSLWGRTPRPPHSTGTRKKKTRKAGARVMLTGRTKSIDLIETSSTALSVST